MKSLKDKPSEYYKKERRGLISHIPAGEHCVLEVGCAEGKTGARLKSEGRASKVVGLELNHEIALRAEENLDCVICGDIEKIQVPEPYGKYDYVLLGDVLEHLVDPWGAIEKLKLSLSSQGTIVFSVPNIRNWTVLFPLVFKGKWEYERHGIMDTTHLRFFTKRTCRKLVEEVDMRLISISPEGSRVANKFHRLHLSLLVDFTAVQYVIVCEKK